MALKELNSVNGTLLYAYASFPDHCCCLFLSVLSAASQKGNAAFQKFTLKDHVEKPAPLKFTAILFLFYRHCVENIVHLQKHQIVFVVYFSNLYFI